MQRVALFENKKEQLVFIFFALFIFCINLFIKYQDYKSLTSKSYNNTTAKVLSIYPKTTKKGKKYTLLKLKDKNGINFFGIYWHNLDKDIVSKVISFKLKTKNISFYRYLKGFFTPIYRVKVISKSHSLKDKIISYIKSEHKNIFLKELFSALFLGDTLSKNSRDKIQLLGVSHLVAISGFHLSLLLAIFYMVLTPIYRFFQDRFFPYRSRKLDLMIISIFLLLAYLYIVGFLPSLIRSFAMVIIGYIFYIRHIKILSFETLFVTMLLLLALFPTLLFSLSFWFSIAGVFYIFLFLHYFSFLKTWQIFVLLNFWVYFMMLPIVHIVFGSFSFYQLFSPLLTIAFTIFYPFELFLHLIGQGSLLDAVLMKLFMIKAIIIEVKTPIYFALLYIFISLLSIYKKIFLYLLVFLDSIFFLYLVYVIGNNG